MDKDNNSGHRMGTVCHGLSPGESVSKPPVRGERV